MMKSSDYDYEVNGSGNVLKYVFVGFIFHKDKNVISVIVVGRYMYGDCRVEYSVLSR